MRLTARVPATSANLGPGFDCLALALDLVNEVVIDTGDPAGVTWEGEGAAELPTDGGDMVSHAMRWTAEAAGRELPPVAMHGLNRIPLERGLGSSAAACVAGIVLADRVLGLGMASDDVLRVAVDLEGHPDNAAAAIHGGLAIVVDAPRRVVRLDAHPDLRPVVLIPPERLATADARAALPAEVPFGDAVFNAGRAALAVVALTRRPELLSVALEDRLHQDRRLRMVPSVMDAFGRYVSADVPICVSGAGPTLLAFDVGSNVVVAPDDSWLVLRPGVRSSGAEIVEA